MLFWLVNSVSGFSSQAVYSLMLFDILLTGVAAYYVFNVAFDLSKVADGRLCHWMFAIIIYSVLFCVDLLSDDQ